MKVYFLLSLLSLMACTKSTEENKKCWRCYVGQTQMAAPYTTDTCVKDESELKFIDAWGNDRSSSCEEL